MRNIPLAVANDCHGGYFQKRQSAFRLIVKFCRMHFCIRHFVILIIFRNLLVKIAIRKLKNM